MQRKACQITENAPMTANEPAVAYGTMVAGVSSKWNPNVPFHCTQEEFLEHIRSIEQSIEQGVFMTAEESEKDFEQWKKNLLASRI